MHRNILKILLIAGAMIPHAIQSNNYLLAALGVATTYTGHKAYHSWKQTHYQNQQKNIIDEPQLPDNAPVITLFVHGIGGTRNSGYYYQKHGCINTPLQTFDFPDSHIGQGKGANLAQDIDIACLKSEYEKAVKNGNKVILYGVSRGAATILTFMGTHQTKNIKAIICDSPFDTIDSVITNILRRYYLHWIPGLSTIGAFIGSFKHSAYKLYGISPVDVIHKIQKDVPILLIASQEDTLVPADCSWNLIKQLRRADHTSCWILITSHGAHGNIVGGPEGIKYRNDVNKFLQLYHLPHKSDYADESAGKIFSLVARDLLDGL